MNLVQQAKATPGKGKRRGPGRYSLWTKELRQCVEVLREKGYGWSEVFSWLHKHGEDQFASPDSLTKSYYALRRKGAK